MGQGRQNYLCARMSGCIGKPVELDALKAVIAEVAGEPEEAAALSGKRNGA